MRENQKRLFDGGRVRFVAASVVDFVLSHWVLIVIIAVVALIFDTFWDAAYLFVAAWLVVCGYFLRKAWVASDSRRKNQKNMGVGVASVGLDRRAFLRRRLALVALMGSIFAE